MPLPCKQHDYFEETFSSIFLPFSSVLIRPGWDMRQSMPVPQATPGVCSVLNHMRLSQ